jgi:predicted amidohydrolase YtcJ
MKLYEGSIVTCDEKSSVWRYLVEDRGQIVYTGNELPEQYQHLPKIELGTRALLPSFTDTHLHFSSFALFASIVDVREARTHDDTVEIMLAYRREKRPPFILGFGASAHSVVEQKLVTREAIDRAINDIPVMLIKYDGHASVNNSRMLSILPAEISTLRGFHADSGELNQESYFAAVDFMTRKISPLTLLSNMLKGYDLLAQKGFGAMHTVEGVGFPRDLDVDTVRAVARAQHNPFQTRIFFQTMDIDKVKRRKLPRIGGCFAAALDGCFGSLDAALHESYSDDPANRGILFYTQAQVDDFCIRANRAGLQIQMHAIGDAACDQGAAAIDAALKDTPCDDHRHTLIHMCLPTEKSLEICARQNIGIAAQSSFLDWNLEPQSYLEKILGERADKILPLSTMKKMGIPVSFGSDAPCTLPDPVVWLHNACNHPTAGESVSVSDALRMLTYNAAWTGFDEKERGTLETGKIADMVIMNKNPLEIPRKELNKLKVESLILGGKPYKEGQSLGGFALRAVFRKKVKI